MTTNKHWPLVFLTYGDYTVDEEIPSRRGIEGRRGEPNGSDEERQVLSCKPVKIPRRKYDGLVASVDLLVALSTISLVSSLTPLLIQEPYREQFQDNLTPEIVLILLMTVGLISILLFVRRKDAFDAKSYDKLMRKSRFDTCKGADRILFVAGLVLFYTLSFGLDFFHILAQIHCGEVWMKCGNRLRTYYIVDIIFHSFRIVFFGCSTFFAIIYRSFIFASKCWVRYCLAILFGVSLALWFDVLLQESVKSIGIGNITDEFIHLENDTMSCLLENRTDRYSFHNFTLQCFGHETELFNLLNRNVVPLCYPFMYESCVLLSERFIHWFCHCRKQPSQAEMNSYHYRNKSKRSSRRSARNISEEGEEGGVIRREVDSVEDAIRRRSDHHHHQQQASNDNDYDNDNDDDESGHDSAERTSSDEDNDDDDEVITEESETNDHDDDDEYNSHDDDHANDVSIVGNCRNHDSENSINNYNSINNNNSQIIVHSPENPRSLNENIRVQQPQNHQQQYRQRHRQQQHHFHHQHQQHHLHHQQNPTAHANSELIDNQSLINGRRRRREGRDDYRSSPSSSSPSPPATASLSPATAAAAEADEDSNTLNNRPSNDSNSIRTERRAGNVTSDQRTIGSLGCALFFLFTISTNVLFFVFAILPLALKLRGFDVYNADKDNIAKLYLYYTIIYYLSIFVSVIYGFTVAKDFPLRRSNIINSFQGLDYLLLISSSGPFAYNIFSLVAACNDPSVLYLNGMTAVGSVLVQISNILEVYVQIPFCFFAGRVTAVYPDGSKRPRSMQFQAVLIHVSVCNVTLWLVNSFATTYNNESVYYASHFFDETCWKIINSSILPLTLFFRFNSFLLIVKALRIAFRKGSAEY